MLVDIVTILCLIALVVGWPVALVRAIRGPKGYERRVRDWARENGYAILTIKYQGSLMGPWLFALFGWLGVLLNSFWLHSFRLLIQDDQGGQTNVTVFVGKPNQPMDVRWG